MIRDSKSIKSIYGTEVRPMSMSMRVTYDKGTKAERVGYVRLLVGVPSAVPYSHPQYRNLR